ncbi:hypothetical protein F4809DRAFT_587232 [Biscogniauxia mediterranea]|nr:hypothetical protein F4809DRAFT_587232 [Biscogniauxia mediterranea]
MDGENEVISISSGESLNGDEYIVDKSAVSKWQTALLKCLDGIEVLGDFGTAKHYSSFVNPGLEVDGSLIPLPLTPRDAENIKRICRQAPFGKGDETVVDTSVRDTWELDRSRFQISNPKWDWFLSTIMVQVSEDLGMSNVAIEPYKLLLYETGSFFKRHKDSEKAPRMIGTLVISLPSKHEGGEVRLSHCGKTRVFGTAQSSAFDLSALAWYSDVTHEVTKLTAGYRLILTYNIILAAGARDAPGPALFERQQEQIRQLLAQWRTKYRHIKQQLYFFDHKYTKSSVSLNNLKGQDRAVCQALHNVCLDSGFFLLLAKVTKSVDDEDDPDNSYISIDSVMSCDGLEISPSHGIRRGDILGRDPWAGQDPDSEDEGEFTGNENMPATLRYHDTAAMIIPLNGLAEFLSKYDKKANQVIVNIAAEHLEKKRNDQSVQEFAKSLMKKALVYPLSGSTQATIAKWAITLRDDEFYQKVVHYSLRSSSYDELIVVVSHAILDAYAEDSSKLPDWNIWLSGFITGYTNLTIFASVLASIERLLGDSTLQSSFREWRFAKLDEQLGSKKPLDTGDYDFIVLAASATTNDLDRFSTRIITKLADAGTRDLIYQLLEYFIQDSRGKALKNAEAVAKLMLESLHMKLSLEIKDLAPSYHVTHYYASPSHVGKYCDKFISLLDEVLKLKWNDHANKLLDSSCSNIVDALQEPGISRVSIQRVGVEKFLLSLVSVLRERRVAPRPSVRGLFELLLRKYIIAEIPQYPRQSNGWAHRPRGCRNSTCSDCRELDRFITSEQLKEASWKIGEKRRQHLEGLLPSSVFKTRRDVSTRPATFYVTKRGTEYKTDLDAYKRQLQAVKDRLNRFRGEYMQQLLGVDLYHELIMLESTPGSECGAQGGSEARKRKTVEPPELPNALKRQKQ